MANQEHKATHIELMQAILMDYKIQSLQATEPDFLWDNDLPKWDKSDPPPAFLATVKVEVESQGVTPIKKVILYRMAWDREKKEWKVRYSLEGI